MIPDHEIKQMVAKCDQRTREENKWIETFGEMVSVIDEAASIVNNKVSEKSDERWPDWGTGTLDGTTRVDQFLSHRHSYHYFCQTRWGLDRETSMSFKARYVPARRRAGWLMNVWKKFGDQSRKTYTELVREKWGESSKEYEMFHRFVYKMHYATIEKK